MLRDIPYQGVYKSDKDNLLEDFYFPALSNAIRYDRAVGFFSASTISYAAQALSTFVRSGGRIRLILGAFSEQRDLEAINRGYGIKEITEKIGVSLLSTITNVNDELFQNRFETLSWLVAYGHLEVKIALRMKGMFHDKIGIIADEVGDKVVFAGSANESTHALLPTHNFESINVFRSWMPEHSEFYEPHIESFDRLWNNKSHATEVIDIPIAVKEKLISTARSMDYEPDPEIELEIANRIFTKDSVKTSSTKPTNPTIIDGQPFKLLDHQVAALEAWRAKGDFQGILDLATGAGKTITAIHAIVRVSERTNNLVCVVAVPYQNLADQWVDVFSKFNIYPLRCYFSRVSWEDKFQRLVHEMTMGSRKFAAIVVVNRTLKSREFQSCLAKLAGNRLFWIGDECHHHSSTAFDGCLPEHARFRLGLSATPKHYLHDDRNKRLKQYYGSIVSSYTLNQAISDKVLTPYSYYPHLVEFTEAEAMEFVELSEEIGRLMSRQNDLEAALSTTLKAILMQRARVIGSASNKIQALKDILADKKPSTHTLFYCGDGTVETDTDIHVKQESDKLNKRQIESISNILHELSWNVSRFTSRESNRDRDNILQNFRLGVIDAMVAIRCLDEGIDVPACSTAYILASSRDPRQFIQRRGRILRRSPGKNLATIHDFIVVLPEDFRTPSTYAKNLVKSELKRVAEFSSMAVNRSDAYTTLAPVLRAYNLEHKI